MQLFYIASLLMAVGAFASELIPAKRMAQSIDTRASFYGGWPIAANTCPSNTTSCGDGSCCPSSTDCYTAGLSGVAVCCPDSSDCSNTANTLPVCADPSWTLYIGNYYYFCCASGQIGILPNKESSVAAGLCVDDSVSPAASVRATPYGAANPTTAAPTSSTPSATTTSPLSTTSSTSTPKPSTNSSPNTVPVSTSATSSSTTLPTSSTSQPSNSTTNSSSNTGAIAGGVVGGVVGLILIVVAIWFFSCRRRNSRAIMPAETSYAADPVQKYAPVRDQELNEIAGPMAGNYGYGEMAATGAAPAKGYSEMAVADTSPKWGYNEMAAPEVPLAQERNFKSARISPSELA